MDWIGPQAALGIQVAGINASGRRHVRIDPLPSGFYLGLVNGRHEEKVRGWEAGEVSIPVLSALTAGCTLTLIASLYPRPQLLLSGPLPTAAGLSGFQDPLSPWLLQV